MSRDHVHFLDSKDLRCAICGMDARRCQHEQGRVAIAVSQPVPSNRVGNRVFLYGHEVRIVADWESASINDVARRIQVEERTAAQVRAKLAETEGAE